VKRQEGRSLHPDPAQGKYRKRHSRARVARSYHPLDLSGLVKRRMPCSSTNRVSF
jgi:hypothetical protein